MNRFLLVFIDGIGLGPVSDDNPFIRCRLTSFERLAGDRPWTIKTPHVSGPHHQFLPIDATLGVDGLPQSGTGQASLFTGINCAKLAGRHFGPFPHSTSRPVLASRSIFRKVLDATGSVAFANAYPPRFFEYVRKRDRWSVTTRCCLDASVKIRTLEDLRDGTAVAADITGLGLKKVLNLEIDPITEEDAADRLSDLASRNHFTAFEYFHTDKAGHARSMAAAEKCLLSLDRFIGRLLENVARTGVTLIITSDHGNLEDLSVKTHTSNPVPLAVYGPTANFFSNSAALTDVVPAIMQGLSD